MADNKLSWHGTVIAVQPRIRLTRSFDQRYHAYLGYTLHLQGEIGDEERGFLVGMSEAAQTKHQFRVGDTVSGQSAAVTNPQMDPVDYYKTNSLCLIEQAARKDNPHPGMAYPLS